MSTPSWISVILAVISAIATTLLSLGRSEESEKDDESSSSG